MRDSALIKHNVARHNRLGAEYQQLHGEIYNEIEQERLQREVAYAVRSIMTHSRNRVALDFGCGTGNLTACFVRAGLSTIAADVSTALLNYVREQYSHEWRVTTCVLNGSDLSNFSDASFDIVGTYSVLHHVPDYLKAVAELARVLKPGGIIYIDHEAAPDYWRPSPAYREYRKSWKPERVARRSWLRPSAYYYRLKRVVDRRFSAEGDIHVWPDDHIEWGAIEELLVSASFEVIRCHDYLLYRRGCPAEVHRRYAERCTDMRLLVARRSL